LQELVGTGVKRPVFPTSLRALISWLAALILSAPRYRKSLQGRSFGLISNRCAKMAIWRWHDFCPAAVF
jgi:hypothetical protein